MYICHFSTKILKTKILAWRNDKLLGALSCTVCAQSVLLCTVMHSLCKSMLLCTAMHSLGTVSVTGHCHAQPVHSHYYCALSCTACAQSVLLCNITHSLCTVIITVHYHAQPVQSVLLCTIMHSLCTFIITVHYHASLCTVLLWTVMHSLCTVIITVHYHAQPVHSQCYYALSCTTCAHSVFLCTYLLTREHQQLVKVTEQELTWKEENIKVIATNIGGIHIQYRWNSSNYFS
jgi:hypothetical protein